MHELAIANSVLHEVRAEAARHPSMRPRRVGLRLGEWSGVDPAALRFSLEVLASGSDLAGLALDIEEQPRRNRCAGCGTEFRVLAFDATCPACHAPATDVIAGFELQLAYVELEEV